VISVAIRFDAEAAPRATRPGPAPGALDAALLPGVIHTIAIASGKGGVGKSTVAVNLAVGLAQRGARVGLLDADIYGPSIPIMMGTDERPEIDASGRTIKPFDRWGVRFMSLGFLVDRDAAVIWRGPMVMKAIEQLLRDVAWGELDVLVVDMPPGTGDAQLTLSQKVRLSGAVIVTTPQDVALADAIKGVAMFRKVGVPVLGIVENMSSFHCPHCGNRTDVFGHGGGRREAARLEAPFLGEIPLDASIREGGDAGRPVVVADPASTISGSFLSVADKVLHALGGDADGSGADVEGGGLIGWLRRGWTR
jgi:ATP-binding protein involved in chromosome partitioning